MSNITVTYKGLTGKQGSITIDNGQTIDSLISSIASAESISQTNYYNISLMRNFIINSITYSDSSSTLSSLGIVTGDSILCTPNQNGSKQERQIQKLDIAAAAKSGDGLSRVTYDITQLPTQYRGNTIVDNDNSGGLVVGRPWTSTITLRSFLSGAGQTAYDAASADSFFAVSSTDWNAVVAGVASTSKLGPDDTNFTATSGGAFSGGYYFTASQTLATVPANNYIIGFRATSNSGLNQVWKIYGSTTFKSYNPNPYTQISSDSPGTGSSTGTFYYLRKAPTVQAVTTYIAHFAVQNFDMTPNGSYLTPAVGATSSAYSANLATVWSNWVDRIPKIQTLITPTVVV